MSFSLIDLVINIVGDNKIRCLIRICHLIYHVQKLYKGFLFKPVIGIKNPEEQSGSVIKTGHHSIAVAAVFLPDQMDRVRIFIHVFSGDL